ncbi:hypothetical protein [Hydrogenophaga sp. BPS33]|uniref:hypothetical protein n=1 Tax=Hydrogenophaga sp. BPS33 TaxID=2651974 RepID=UPI00132040F5|nr:hypothetical protein [Hydrogenophaga sp. BPS33]QHE86683.1 hypothetical protein F9K07_18150 [Hydrogenophaga sp. BPS33]
MSIVKTEAGQRVLKDRSVPLTPRQRSVFVLIDGKRSMREVLAASAALGAADEDVERLFELGLIADAAPPPAVAQAAAALAQEEVVSEAPERSPAQRYQDAYPIATQLTAALGLRGFRLNLAVEAAGNYEQLLALSPRIQEAIGAKKFAPLAAALGGR